ncbi:hypothetical protein sos41_11450 [Alphaproteobacteria bacterium SO-S41]|nr:hypothetical protein sos41_11450 [Alphaproteobacteria bacterium SO-S41]
MAQESNSTPHGIPVERWKAKRSGPAISVTGMVRRPVDGDGAKIETKEERFTFKSIELRAGGPVGITPDDKIVWLASKL